jgi:hypothetical protein
MRKCSGEASRRVPSWVRNLGKVAGYDRVGRSPIRKRLVR